VGEHDEDVYIRPITGTWSGLAYPRPALFPFLSLRVSLCFPYESLARMKRSDNEYQESLSYLRAKLAEPEAQVDAWSNEMVDSWISALKAKRSRRPHV